MWARVRLGREREVDVAREYGYADSSGVTQVIKRVEALATTDGMLVKKLDRLMNLSKVND
jgi:ribosomal protein L15E